jgi:hypothetical protein
MIIIIIIIIIVVVIAMRERDYYNTNDSFSIENDFVVYVCLMFDDDKLFNDIYKLLGLFNHFSVFLLFTFESDMLAANQATKMTQRFRDTFSCRRYSSPNFCRNIILRPTNTNCQLALNDNVDHNFFDWANKTIEHGC